MFHARSSEKLDLLFLFAGIKGIISAFFFFFFFNPFYSTFQMFPRLFTSEEENHYNYF